MAPIADLTCHLHMICFLRLHAAVGAYGIDKQACASSHLHVGRRSQREKEGLVADLTRTGASMRVGPAASRKLFAFLTASDPLQEMGDLGSLV